MVAKSTEQPREMVRNPIYGLTGGNVAVSYMWVVISRVLGVKMQQILDNREWVAECEHAYSQWLRGPVGERADRAMTMQAIWTDKRTGQQIDPATATQPQETKPMAPNAPLAHVIDKVGSLNMPTKPFPAPPFAPIVELAAQFEVAQKRLAAAAAEHKAAQESLESLRAQLTQAIKA
jgi:hypothetical protein